jgi:HlyD family secretion protein
LKSKFRPAYLPEAPINKKEYHKKYIFVLFKRINIQKEIVGEQHQLSGNSYIRDSLLNIKGIISNQDIEESQMQYLQSRLSLENSVASLENLQIQILQIREALLDIEQQYWENKNSLELDLNTSAIQLMNEIKTWEMAYVLASPINGKITFTNYWSENQNIVTGECVFTVVPAPTSGYFGKATLPINRSGKVKVGQKVNVYFANYPDVEFGSVKGRVKNISLIPVNGHYVVDIHLYDGLKTTYNKVLPFSQEMEARADIITEDIRLLERFFMPIKKIISESL